MRQGVGQNRVTLKHVHSVRVGGKVYRYLRIPGRPRVRLPDLPPEHPEFLAAYLAASADHRPAVRGGTGTIAAMIEAYLKSDRHLALSPDYRRIIRREAEAIRETGGHARAKDIRPEHIRADLAGLSPHASVTRRKAWRLICSYGFDAGLLTIDPSEAAKARATPKSAGHPPWTPKELQAFRDRWPIDTVQRRCFELLLWTGARISDAVRLGPGMIGADGVLSFRQSKTGEMAFIPWTCQLPSFATVTALDRAQMMEALSHAPRQMTFLATVRGAARSHKALGQIISEAARKSEVQKSAHGLRKTRAVMLAEGGATPHQIGAWTGHITLTEVAHYTAAVNRRRAVIGTDDDRESVKTSDQAVK